MKYSFELGKNDYIHIVSSAIREELGKTLMHARQKQNLTIMDIFKNKPSVGAIAHSIERNLRRNSWNSIKKLAIQYGYDVHIHLTFSVDVALSRREPPKN